MMVSLFSVFDPVAFLGFSLNWVSLIMVILIFPWVKFKLMGYNFYPIKMVMGKLSKIFKEISIPDFLGVVVVSSSLFMYISLMNGVGLFPFVFTGTSHLSVTLSMGLVFWMSFFLMGWVKSFKKSSAHLVPEGSPIFLSPLMVMIESVSHIIRPVTLSVRLAANMMAGHLIIGLISSMSFLSLSGMLCSIVLQSVLLLLEIAVAFIQAFVFSVLVMLYSLEYK